MTVNGAVISNLVEELAPLELAEEWDNSGWQLGDPGASVRRVLLALDVDQDVCREARARDVQLIVSHHPLFFKGIKQIRLDRPAGVLVAELLRAGIGVYAAHTNLDSARRGVNDVLAAGLELRETAVLKPGGRERYLKLAVFVPADHAEAVKRTLGDAGAGWIGNYSHCTFAAPGTGTFLPLTGTNPYTGRVGQLAEVAEVRLETILPASIAGRVIEAMLAVHPYEEVAYDLYPLANRVKPTAGLGRTGMLPQALPLADFAGRVRGILSLPGLRWGGAANRAVRRVALCGGAGAGLWPEALAAGADVLVTGDVGYHAARDMLAAGMAFIDAGHYGTEKVILPALRDYLAQRCREKELPVEFMVSEAQADPFSFS
ncbi:Nif3-like dinuclear metal center hexameric protein [Desulfotomaculum copahuensis]|uniref:Nif3-like dinuclear metal center hexameric protein n=1 Tax=Desulfotomaculum copahuensis TaxID=1838280 RepID=UPI0012493AEB